jgi:hypothetical protein
MDEKRDGARRIDARRRTRWQKTIRFLAYITARFRRHTPKPAAKKQQKRR